MKRNLRKTNEIKKQTAQSRNVVEEYENESDEIDRKVVEGKTNDNNDKEINDFISRHSR